MICKAAMGGLMMIGGAVSLHVGRTGGSELTVCTVKQPLSTNRLSSVCNGHLGSCSQFSGEHGDEV